MVRFRRITRRFCLDGQPNAGLQSSIAEVTVCLLSQRRGELELLGIALFGKSLQSCAAIGGQV